jgi:predicted nuclease of predicted toxin-antitoxin system
MRFLLDANMPRSAAELIARYGHEAVDIRDVAPGGVDDSVVASYARTHGLVLVTRDFDFADIRNYPPVDYPGILVLELPDDAIAAVILKVLESFLGQSELVARLPGRLAVVELWRVRFRPA